MPAFRNPLKPSAGAAASGRKKTLVFHIGDHKAGSTSIQNAFATGRVHLDGVPLHYPAELNHNYLVKTVPSKTGQDRPRLQLRPREVSKLADAVRRAKEEVCLISAENFEGLAPEDFARMLDGHFRKLAGELRIIAYVRPHTGRILSNFTEQVKIGRFNGSLESFVERTEKNGRFFYEKRLAAWHRLFGDELVVRPLLRSELHNGDVLEDFIRTGIGDVPYRIDAAPNANESLSLEDLLIVRMVQRRLDKGDKALRLAVGWELARIMGGYARPEGQGTRLRMPRDLAAKIAATYAEDARAMDTLFFAGRPLLQTELETAVETASPEPQSMQPKDYFSPDEIRNLNVLADVIARMMTHKGGDWAGFFRQERINALHAADTA